MACFVVENSRYSRSPCLDTHVRELLRRGLRVGSAVIIFVRHVKRKPRFLRFNLSIFRRKVRRGCRRDDRLVARRSSGPKNRPQNGHLSPIRFGVLSLGNRGLEILSSPYWTGVKKQMRLRRAVLTEPVRERRDMCPDGFGRVPLRMHGELFGNLLPYL